jgi:hypothetical protein
LLKYFPEVILYNYVKRVFNNAYWFHFRLDKTWSLIAFYALLVSAEVPVEEECIHLLSGVRAQGAAC